jgi:hypothetical protein
MPKLTLIALLAAFAVAVQAQQPLSQTSLLSVDTVNGNVYNGHQWWDVRQGEVARVQSMAALFGNGLRSSPGALAGMFTELVALVSTNPK